MDVLAPLVAARDTDAPYASLAASTIASHRRQLGAHAAAYRWDSRALGLARRGRGADSDGALADAVLGLAADAIGRGQLDRCARLLHRLRAAGAGSGWRAPIRCGWVTTEWLLASGHQPAALRQARLTRDHAESTESVRHRAKSAMLLATCLLLDSTERGRSAGADMARDVVRVSLSRGMLALAWPTALLLGTACDDQRARWMSLARDALTTVYRHSDGEGRRAALRSLWMPTWLLRAGEREPTVGLNST